jgi:hypothetical protein
MFKSMALLALGVTLSACATRQAAQSAEAAPPPEAQAQSRRVCEIIEDDATGTKISTRKECHDVVDDDGKQPKTD